MIEEISGRRGGGGRTRRTLLRRLSAPTLIGRADMAMAVSPRVAVAVTEIVPRGACTSNIGPRRGMSARMDVSVSPRVAVAVAEIVVTVARRVTALRVGSFSWQSKRTHRGEGEGDGEKELHSLNSQNEID